MNGDEKVFEKILTINEIEEIEDALSYNSASSVGYANSKLSPIINFFKNINCELKVKKTDEIISFDSLQSFKNWLKEAKYDCTYYELRITNVENLIKHYR